jgi:hypothetical protein
MIENFSKDNYDYMLDGPTMGQSRRIESRIIRGDESEEEVRPNSKKSQRFTNLRSDTMSGKTTAKVNTGAEDEEYGEESKNDEEINDSHMALNGQINAVTKKNRPKTAKEINDENIFYKKYQPPLYSSSQRDRGDMIKKANGQGERIEENENSEEETPGDINSRNERISKTICEEEDIVIKRPATESKRHRTL